MLYALFYGGLAGALITLVIAAILFVKLDIAEVIRDLFGIHRKPGAKKEKRRVFRTGPQSHTGSQSCSQPFSQTGTQSGDGPSKWPRPWTREVPGLQSLAEDSSPVLAHSMQPSASSEPTALLQEEFQSQQDVWPDSRTGQETVLLDADSDDETTLLGAWPEEDRQEPPGSREFFFKKDMDIMVVHSDIII